MPRAAIRLAWADLRHERVFSLCMVLAVAAVVSPLLILFGVKNGAVETLRDRLTTDPRNREIRPVGSGRHLPAWFEKMATREDVAFISPATRSLAATVTVRIAGTQGSGEPLDLIPSGPGDPLLLDNGAPAPNQGECVLSANAAETLGANAGETLTILVTRLENSGEIETARARLVVAGIASPRAGATRSLFAPLAFVDAVERFKDGLAVPEFGWAGQGGAVPVFDGAVVLLKAELDRVTELTVIQNTGFTRIETIPLDRVLGSLGYLPEAEYIRLASTAGQPVQLDSVRALGRKLGAAGASVHPYVHPLEATLLPREASGGGQPLLVMAGLEEDILLPPGIERPDEAAMLFPSMDEPLRVPVELAHTRAPGDVALLPPRLAGMARLARERAVAYDPDSDAFLLQRNAYAGFRLYASRIEDVADMKAEFEAQGIEVHTRAERIRDVLELDRYLGLIYWAIAAVGAAGGMGALLASMYASVERKRRDLAVLRLLGLTGLELHAFPVTQSLALAGGGFGAAMAVYFLVAAVIDGLFAGRLQQGESLCRLSFVHGAWVVAIVLGLALVAGWSAARRVARVDPAEALRDE
jgi:putative ABC transport system permease protein